MSYPKWSLRNENSALMYILFFGVRALTRTIMFIVRNGSLVEFTTRVINVKLNDELSSYGNVECEPIPIITHLLHFHICNPHRRISKLHKTNLSKHYFLRNVLHSSIKLIVCPSFAAQPLHFLNVLVCISRPFRLILQTKNLYIFLSKMKLIK